MKILFVQPTGDKRGHYGVYTVHLCQELARLGHKVTLFTNKIYPEKFLKEKILFEIIEAKSGKYSFSEFDEKKNQKPLFYIFGYLRNSFLILKAALEFLKKNNLRIYDLKLFSYS